MHEAELSTPGFSAFSVKNLNVDFRQSAYVINIQAPEVSIGYLPLALLSGKLEWVNIPQLRVTFTEDLSYIAPTDVSSSALPLPLPKQFLQDMPVERLDIERLSVEVPAWQEYRQFTGYLSFTDQALSLQLQNQGLASAELSLLADHHNTLTAELTMDGVRVLSLDSRVTLESSPGNGSDSASSAEALAKAESPDKKLSGNLEVNLDKASGLASQLSLIPAEYFLGGKLITNWSMSLPKVLDSTSLEQLRLMGNLASEGDYSLPQQGPGGSSTMRGTYKLQANYELTEQNLVLKTNEVAISAQLPLPAEFTDLNPLLGAKPLTVVLNLEPEARLLFKADLTTISVKNLAGELQIKHSDAGLDALLNFNSALLEHSTNNETPGLATNKNSNTTVSTGSGIGAGSINSNIEFTLKGFMDSFTTTDFSAETLRLDSTGLLSLNASKFTLTTNSPTVFSAENIHSRDGTKLALPTLKISAQAPVSLTVSEDNIDIPSAQLLIREQQVRLRDLDVYFSQALITLSDLALSMQQGISPTADVKSVSHQSAGFKAADMEIDITDLKISPQELKLAPVKINANLKLRNDQIDGYFTAKVGDDLLTSKGVLEHDLLTGQGELHSDAQSSIFTEQQAFLPRLLIPTKPELAKLPLDLSAGKINLDTRMEWNNQGLNSTSADISLQNVSGFYQRNFLKNVNANLHIDGFHEQWHLTANAIHIAEFDIGLPVTNIQLGLNVRPGMVMATDFEAELLGGLASQKTILYDRNKFENKWVLNLEHIQLAQVLELVSDISGSGSFDGSIPVELSPEGIRIVNGHINNRQPGGIIKYDAGMASGNSALDAGLQLTLNALKNFHYNFLGAKINADEKGNITLGATLKGNNPDLKDQPPVHFNLNITENIPDLLKSLKLAQDISDDLNKRIEYFYKPGKQRTLQ